MDSSIEPDELASNFQAKSIIESAFMGSRDFDEAHLAAEQILKPFTDSASASILSMTNYAALLLNLGNHGEGAAILEEVIKNNLPHSQIYYNYAVALMNLGRQSEAKVFFERSSSLLAHPAMIEAYFDPHGY